MQTDFATHIPWLLKRFLRSQVLASYLDCVKLAVLHAFTYQVFPLTIIQTKGGPVAFGVHGTMCNNYGLKFNWDLYEKSAFQVRLN